MLPMPGDTYQWGGSILTKEDGPRNGKKIGRISGKKRVENRKSGYGKNVIIDHGYGYKTLYAHMRKIDVKVGQKVIVSPPPDNPMEFVMISADGDVFVNKAYREMPKMVGMMGS